LTVDFTYENTIPASSSTLNFANPDAFTFKNDFTVSADTEVIVTSTFTGDLDYWVQTLKIEAVPAPLPLFGAATAFGWSRRIRK